MKKQITRVSLPYTKFPTLEELISKRKVTLNTFVFYDQLVSLKLVISDYLWIYVYLIFNDLNLDGMERILTIYKCQATTKNYEKLQDKIHEYEFKNNVSLKMVDDKQIQEVYRLLNLKEDDDNE